MIYIRSEESNPERNADDNLEKDVKITDNPLLNVLKEMENEDT